MPIYLIDKVKPYNDQPFALIDAVDVEMPDGKRLSELDLTVPQKEELVEAVLAELPAAEGVSY